MKKFYPILVIACFAMLFCACHKEGVFNPKKKISRIYEDSGNGRNLSQVWTWNKNNTLEKIDYYYNGQVDYTDNFTYEKKRLVSIEDYKYHSRAEFSYANKVFTKQLTEVNVYSSNTLTSTYAITHEKNKISQIIQTNYSNNYNDDYDWKSAAMASVNALNFILPKEMCKAVMEAEKKMAKNGSKNSTITYTLTWDKNNLSKVDLLWSDGTTGSLQAKYDDKNNPFWGALLSDDGLDISGESFSKNNMTRLEENYNYMGENGNSTYTYSYSYDGKYPKSQRRTYEYNGQGDGMTKTTDYEYKN